MPSLVPPPVSTDGVTTQQSPQGVVSVIPQGVLSPQEKVSDGTAAAGTLATLTATAGKNLFGIRGRLKNGSTSGDTLLVTVTYQDDSTDTFTTVGTANAEYLLLGPLVARVDTAATTYTFSGMATKKVKGIKADKAGAGGNNRQATLCALEV